MENYTEQQLSETAELINFALQGQHNKKETLKNLTELYIAFKIRNANISVAKTLNKSANKLFKDYLKEYTYNAEKLILFKNIKACEKFYYEEAELLQESISDYINYIFDWHIIRTLLGFERKIDE